MARPCQGQLGPWRGPSKAGRAFEGLAKAGRALGKALPRTAGSLAMPNPTGLLAKPCHGQPGLAVPCQSQPCPWQGPAKDGRVVGKALLRPAGPLAKLCQGQRALGKALPRTTGSLARPCQGQPGPWQRLAKGSPPWQGFAKGMWVLSGALPRAAKPLAMPCQGRPGRWEGLARVGKALPSFRLAPEGPKTG